MLWNSSKKKEKKSNVIGAYAAKTNMGQYLTAVEDGESFTITRNGRPVATLLPYKGN